ncbi:MAG: glycosyltransferase family 9 protein [Desulfovibrionales bacterium]
MSEGPPERILVCLRYGIGDVVMEIPALASLRRKYPGARITGLGAQPAMELLEHSSLFDELIGVEEWGLLHWGDTGNRWIRKRFLNWMEKKRFDLIIDPSHAVLAVRDALWKLDLPILDAAEPAQTDALDSGGGVLAIKEAARRCWGIEVPAELPPSIHLSGSERRFADRFLENNSALGRPLLGVSPVASSPLKCWPVGRLAKVADIFSEQGFTILLFRGPQREPAAEFLSHMAHTEHVVQVGSYHLRRVAALLAACTCLLCNDTGLMHMSAAVGTPVVGIFGPTSPRIYLPRDGGSRAVGGEETLFCPYRKTTVFGPSDCLIQGKCILGSASCIRKVKIKDVLMEAEHILACSHCQEQSNVSN